MFQETPGAVEAELEQQGFIVAFEGAKSSSNVALADRYLKWTIMEKSLCSLLNLCATNKIDSMLTTAEGLALWFQSIHILRYKNANISINIVKSEPCCFSDNIYSVCRTRFTFNRNLERVKQGFYMKTAASWTSLLTSCPEKRPCLLYSEDVWMRFECPLSGRKNARRSARWRCLNERPIKIKMMMAVPLGPAALLYLSSFSFL